MKANNAQLKKQNRKKVMSIVFALVWVSLYWEGHRIFPLVKRLSELIPTWIVILNLLFLVIFTILLMSKKSTKRLCQFGIIIMLIVFLLSWTFASVGYSSFPLISAMIGSGVLLLWMLGNAIGYYRYSLKFTEVVNGFLFSWILASLGHHKYPLISSVVGCGVILINLSWKQEKLGERSLLLTFLKNRNGDGSN